MQRNKLFLGFTFQIVVITTTVNTFLFFEDLKLEKLKMIIVK